MWLIIESAVTKKIKLKILNFLGKINIDYRLIDIPTYTMWQGIAIWGSISSAKWRRIIIKNKNKYINQYKASFFIIFGHEYILHA